MYWRKIVFSVFLTIFCMQNIVAEDDINLEILQALNLVDNYDLEGAIKIYEKLYKKTKQGEFLKEAIRLSLNLDTPQLTRLIKSGEVALKKDDEFVRLKSLYLIRQKRLKEAKDIVFKINSTQNDAKNFGILGTIAMIEDDNKTAVLNFKKAYELDKNEENLMRLIRFVDTDDALKILNEFKDKNGCTMAVCGSLLEIYMQNEDLKNMAKINADFFELTDDKTYLKNALGILVYLKDSKAVKELVTKYDFDDKDTVEAYAAIQDYKMAMQSAKKAYESSADVEYLAMIAIFEYEQNLPNISKEILENVIENFEKSALKVDKAMYLNYYGYLLIQHDIDVKKGMNLVKRALKFEPNSSYYLDSLAWGHYKLNECEKAKDIMNKALKDENFKTMPEAKEHSKLIQECVKKGKK